MGFLLGTGTVVFPRWRRFLRRPSSVAPGKSFLCAMSILLFMTGNKLSAPPLAQALQDATLRAEMALVSSRFEENREGSLTDSPIPLTARETARRRVLEALRREGPMARVELGQQLGLSAASVSDLTAGLARGGHPGGRRRRRAGAALIRGRPKTRLSFAANLGTVIGVWTGYNRDRAAPRRQRRVQPRDPAARTCRSATSRPRRLVDVLAGGDRDLRGTTTRGRRP